MHDKDLREISVHIDEEPYGPTRNVYVMLQKGTLWAPCFSTYQIFDVLWNVADKFPYWNFFQTTNV